MRANIGDRIVIASSNLEQPARDGKILEVRGPEGSPPYVVEWSDNGHRGLLFPGPDAHVFGADGQLSAPPAERIVRRHEWRVRVQIVERDGRTDAHAMLVGEAPSMAADGHARLNPSDADVPEIGDEIAVGRALARLAEGLLGTAAEQMGEAAGAPVAVAR